MVAAHTSVDQLIAELEAAAVEYHRAEQSRELAFIWQGTDTQKEIADEVLQAASGRVSRARGALRAVYSRLEESPCTG